MQHYLGFYDISSPVLRAKVFKLLAAYGIHEQKSVFVCLLSRPTLLSLVDQLQQLSAGQVCRIGFLKIHVHDPRNMSVGTKPASNSSGFLYLG